MNPSLLTLVLATLWGASAAYAAQAPDEERFDFETELGPFLASAHPPRLQSEVAASVTHDTSPGASKDGRGSLRFSYRRCSGALPFLGLGVLAADLCELSFDVKARERCWLAVGAEDLDGAKFHHLLEVPGGAWRRIAIRPADFKLNDDSPVRKKSLDPARLGFGLGLVDFSGVGPLPGMPGPHEFWIDNLKLARRPAEVRSGGWTITRDTEVEAPLRVTGDLSVEKGARLTVRNTRFMLEGNLHIQEGGAVRFERGILYVPALHAYQRKAKLEPKSTFEIRESKVILGKPWDLQVPAGARFEARRVDFPSANVTGAVLPGSEVLLDRVSTPGEFVVWPRAQLRAEESSGVLLWFATEAGSKGAFDFPPGERVRSWKAPLNLGFDATVRDCREIMWALVPYDGSEIAASNAKIRAIGLLFHGDAERSVKGLENGKQYGPGPLTPARSRLALNGSAVQTWNFYTFDRAVLNVDACTFGEAIAFGEGRIVLNRSTCDGSGGYFGARARGRIEARHCRLACNVIAHDDAQIVLEDCEITGGVFAADRAKVTLIRCKHTGPRHCAPGARLEER